MMLRAIIALALALHGIGHLLFAANAWGYWKTNETAQMRLTDVIGAGRIGEGAAGLFMLIPLVGFLAITWGYLAHAAWWGPLALATAVLSGGLILLCWGGINTSSALFALVFDIAVVGYALWQGRAMVSFGGYGW
jgi:hypothetical protein